MKRRWLGAVLVLAGCRNYALLDRLVADAGIFDASTSDQSSTLSGDGGVMSFAGEMLSAPPGWTVTLYRDLSSSYVYDKTDFEDPTTGEVDDNHPRRLALLAAPFTLGVVVSLGRDLLEVPEDPGTVVPPVHVYRSVTPDSGTYPDIDSDLDFRTSSTAEPTIPVGILVSGSSLGAGDGVWIVDQTWTMTDINDAANVSSVLYDRVPTVTNGESAAASQIYYSPYASSLPRFVRVDDNAGIVAYDASLQIDDAEPYDEQTFVLAAEITKADMGTQLGLVLAGAAVAPRQLTEPSSTRSEIVLVGGAIEALGGTAVNALYDRTMLVAIDAGGAENVLCRTLAGGWSWTDIVVERTPSGYSYLVLEWQPDNGGARILRITPS